MNTPFKKALLPALITTTLIIGGCGGSSSDDSSDSLPRASRISSGIITGFGSVYVNGVKFETTTTSMNVDDNPTASQDDLRIGMRVKINGTVNDDGVTGTATSLIYQNELKGPVSNLAIDATDPTLATMTILGQQVEINADTRFDQGLTLTDLANTDFIEVSGLLSSTGISATFIERQPGGTFNPAIDQVEIKGVIANLDATPNTFTIRGFNIQYSSTILDDSISALSDGLYVEVKGLLNGAGDALVAAKIESGEDTLGDNADEVEIEGFVADYNAAASTFTIQGQLIDFSAAPVFTPSTLTLADGIKVEAEGSLVGGTLFADKIKLRGQKIKVFAEISSINATSGSASFNLFGGSDNITVRVNQQTKLDDKVNNQAITLSQLVAGDFVEVKAFFDGTSVINAVELKKDNPDDSRLQGPVESFDATVQSVTMFGQTFVVGSTAVYKNSLEAVITAPVFYNQLATGTFVKLTDNAPADGVIDEVELEAQD